MTLSARQKQKDREDRELEERARKRGKLPPQKPAPPGFDDPRIAVVARHLEPILHANAQLTQDKNGVAETYRFVTLYDKLEANGLTDKSMSDAVEILREMWAVSQGRSQGVGLYGEYLKATEPSQRAGTTDRKARAGIDFRKALRAMFAVQDRHGRWIYDIHLGELVTHALFNTEKGLTQADVGRLLTRYEGRAQVGAAGGASLLAPVVRLALYLRTREGLMEEAIPYQKQIAAR